MIIVLLSIQDYGLFENVTAEVSPTEMSGYFNIGEKRYENGTNVYEYYLFMNDESRTSYFLKFDKEPPNIFDLSGNQITVQGSINSQESPRGSLNALNYPRGDINSQPNEDTRFFSNSQVMDVNSIALSNANQNSQLRTTTNYEFTGVERGDSLGSSMDSALRTVPSTLKTVVIMSKFSDSAFGEPQTKSYFQGKVFTDSDSLKKYWEDTSYGAITMSPGTIDSTGVVNWQTMPETGAYYENGGGSNLLTLELLDDAITLADPFVDFNGADNVIQNTGPQIGGPGDNGDDVDQVLLVYNDLFDYTCSCVFAFAMFDPIDIFTNEGTMFVYAVWTPIIDDGFPIGPNWENGVGTFAHEMGHDFEWRHTPPSTGIFVYADPWSVMGGDDADGPAGTIAFNRDQAGWIPSGDINTVSDGTQETFTLDIISDPSPGANYLMGKIPFGVGGEYYTVEARKDSTFDQTPQNQFGLMIYHYNPSGHSGSPEPSAPVNVVDTTGTGDFDNADLDSGQSYTANGITIEYLSDTATSITVRVNNNAVCTPPGSGTWTITSDCTMTSSATAPGNVLVQNNSLLTVPSGITLDINFLSFNLTVESGSGVLIESGGKIT